MLKALIPLNLPQVKLKLAKKNEQPYVWDVVRKKYLLLTPEEWVRQHWIHFLSLKDYPFSNLQLEGGFSQNNLQKRADIVAFKNGKAKLLVECKAPQVHISQATMDQAATYNMHHQASYLVLSNGLVHYCAKVSNSNHQNNAFSFINQLPKYHEL